MTRRLACCVALLLLPAVVRAAPSGESSRALVRKMQHFYESTRDFTADFEQTYHYAAMGRVQHQSGTVQVKKPGFMRWDYVKPYAKIFLLDGKTFYVYDPDDDTVAVNRHFSSDQLSGAVTFLWGRGKLEKEFVITKVDRPDYGPVVLQLIPREPQAGFSKVYFSIDPGTGAVRGSVVFDNDGNENHITFTHVHTNQDLPDSRFHFDIPKDAQVQEL